MSLEICAKERNFGIGSQMDVFLTLSNQNG